MIHMPHRSVTRFFIPLIDVLLLLFVIFLLMPFASEEEVDKKLSEAEKFKEEATALNSEMDRQMTMMQAMEKDREDFKYADYKEMKAEIERLSKLVKQTPQQRYNIVFVDVDKDDGTLSYVDSAGKRRSIKDAKDAQNLIIEKRNEANRNPKLREKRPFYFFLYPRPSEGYPVKEQEEMYRKWFADVDNSL